MKKLCLTLAIILGISSLLISQVELDVRVKLWDNVGRSESEINNIVNAAVSMYFDETGPTYSTVNIISTTTMNGDEFALNGQSMAGTWANAWLYENSLGNNLTDEITIYFFGSSTFSDIEGFAPFASLWVQSINVIMIQEQSTNSELRRLTGHEISHTKGASHSCSGGCSSCGNDLMSSDYCGDSWNTNSIDEIQTHCDQFFESQFIESTFPSFDTLCWISEPFEENVEWEIEHSLDGVNWSVVEDMPIGSQEIHHYVVGSSGYYRPVSQNWNNSETIGDAVYFDMAILPVTFVSYTVRDIGQGETESHLVTEVEESMSHYNVYRAGPYTPNSTQEFELVQSFDAQGGFETHNYFVPDTVQTPGLYHYVIESVGLFAEDKDTTDVVTVNVEFQATNVEELSSWIKVSPNPTYDQVTIEEIPRRDQPILFRIHSITGQLVMETYERQIDMDQFGSGLYFISFEIDQELVRKKVVVLN